VEDVKKLCLSLRRNARGERVLLHYNGHGVPRPTHNGEIWVFNKQYTQYIPLSIYDLQTWMSTPSIYVFDCSAAGTVIPFFLQFAEQRRREHERIVAANPDAGNGARPPPSPHEFIIMASCAANETLPSRADLPADVFTSCLTTPIRMALRWFCKRSALTGQWEFQCGFAFLVFFFFFRTNIAHPWPHLRIVAHPPTACLYL
jgi:regulator-associated protein of mTOR